MLSLQKKQKLIPSFQASLKRELKKSQQEYHKFRYFKLKKCSSKGMSIIIIHLEAVMEKLKKVNFLSLSCSNQFNSRIVCRHYLHNFSQTTWNNRELLSNCYIFGDILCVTDMALLKLPDGTGQHLASISRFGPETCCSRKLQCNTDMALLKLQVTGQGITSQKNPTTCWHVKISSIATAGS